MSKEEKSVNYMFTPVPTQLFYLLDNNCKTILFTLIQASTYFSNDDEFFYLTKESMKELNDLSINVITAALDTLYINNLISIKTVGRSKGKYVNHYKVNFDEFQKYEELSFEDLKNPDNKIKTLKYKNNYQPQYIKDYLSSTDCTQPCKKVITKCTSNSECKQVCKQPCKKVITNIDNINNKYNKNNIYNNILNNKEYIKDNNINIDIIPFKNINKDKIEIETMREQTVKIETRNVNKFQVNLNKLFSKMETVQSLDELDDKLNLLCDWVMKKSKNDSSINVKEVTNVILEKYNSIKNKLEESEKTFSEIIIDNFTPKVEDKTTETVMIDKDKVEKDLISMLDDLKEHGVNDMSLTAFNYYQEKYSKEIEEYNLVQVIDNIKELIQPNKAISSDSKQSSTEISIVNQSEKDNASNEPIISLEESIENALSGTLTLADGKVVNKKDIFVEVQEVYPF